MKSVLAAFVVAVLLAGVPGFAVAEQNIVEINKIDLDSTTENTIAAILTKNIGKVVSIRLGAGEDLSGKIVNAKNGMVHLAELKGRDFSDAVISVNAISAVIIPVRAYKKN